MEEKGNKRQKIDFTGDDRIDVVLTDGKLKTEDGWIFCIHKYALATKNEYFKALFCGMEKDKNDFLILGIKGEVLRKILSYIYSGNIHITNENIKELVIASDYLMVDGILTELKTFMKNNLSINNCIPLLEAASTINREDFVKVSHRFVQTNFERVVHDESIEIADLPLEAFEQLLSDRNLCVSSEMTVFKSIVKWVSFDRSIRLAFVPNLIKYVLLSTIDEDSATEILRHDIVAKNPILQGLNDIRSSFSSSLEVIKSHIQSSPRPESLPIKRIPPKLNCIFFYDPYNRNFEVRVHRTQIHLTYDEQIDLWRNISDIDLPETSKLSFIDDSIYMFNVREERNGIITEGRNVRYSIVDKQLHELSGCPTVMTDYDFHTLVNLEGNIYVIAKTRDRMYNYNRMYNFNRMYRMEIYDSYLDAWFPTAPTPISMNWSFSAAPLNNHIYVVGCSHDGRRRMIAQVFDASTETWSLLPAPPTERWDFKIVSYLEKIYVIGGNGSDGTYEIFQDVVDVFDPAKNEWGIESSLPYEYYSVNAKVFQDLLIVFDDPRRPLNPPVFYNNTEERWESFEESSPLKNVHSLQCFTIDKEEYIDILTRENRHPDIQFEKSPFA